MEAVLRPICRALRREKAFERNDSQRRVDERHQLAHRKDVVILADTIDPVQEIDLALARTER